MMECFNFPIIILLLGIFETGQSIRCYECASRLGPGESDPCLTGEGYQLRRVHCIGPSVCAAYLYQSIIPGAPSINHVTRGCQSIRYGSTCEDIFNELKSKGEILPGQHTCSTCSSDLCNTSSRLNYLSTMVLISFSFVIRVGLS
nr:uncharacterized protein LOC111503020 [Leptinotarsa decemlineata]